jgi:hypothetical protein
LVGHFQQVPARVVVAVETVISDTVLSIAPKINILNTIYLFSL